jgi:hypothetical protein
VFLTSIDRSARGGVDLDCEVFVINGHNVALIDPTTLLAIKCIQLAGEDPGKYGSAF